ncbi:MAG: hypothetical protein JKY22_02340 [Flavobacteriaceae bacterium]|nr:hypothetical protein [Flavobacteriaceae bacterium]
MKNLLLILCLTLCCISCGGNDPSHQIPFIAGYWEIKSVEMPDGTIKEFTVNTSVDYILVKADSGVRKKLMPRLNGSYREFPSSEKFTFINRNDSLLMYYQTPFASWTETVIKADEKVLIVKNKDGKEYIYKRFKASGLIIE